MKKAQGNNEIMLKKGFLFGKFKNPLIVSFMIILFTSSLSMGETQVGGTLGTTSGDKIEFINYSAPDHNTDQLHLNLSRLTEGHDWDSAIWKLQRRVDSTDMGYMQFGPSWGNVVSFGFGTTESFKIIHNGVISCGMIGWGSSHLSTDQGGSIELRGQNTTPYIDFSRDLKTDYSMRIILHPTSNALMIQGGSLQVESTVTAQSYACSSDARYKKNITPISDALQKLMSMNGVYYHWKISEFKDKNFSEERQIGFVAQDVEKVFPELVITGKDGYKSMSYDKITAVLIEAVKEMKTKNDVAMISYGKKIASLEEENKALKAENANFRNKIAKLESLGERLAKIEKSISAEKMTRR